MTTRDRPWRRSQLGLFLPGLLATAVLTALALALCLGDPSRWDPADWSAMAAGGTFVVALITATIALNTYVSGGAAARQQMELTERLAKEQARPYVVAFLRQSPVWPQAIDLVIANMGRTGAHEVRVDMTPAPTRARGAEPLPLPAVIPFLAPGQEWSTLWDVLTERFAEGADMPDEHLATVRLNDSQGQSLPDSLVSLDFGQYRHRRFIQQHGLHQIAKSLKDAVAQMNKWTESQVSGGISVVVRDGHRADDETRAWIEQRDAEEQEN